MAIFYSDPKREKHATALPNCEVFYRTKAENQEFGTVDGDNEAMPAGWYYWYCFQGCMPDSDPIGPFKSERLAIADARENSADDSEE